MNDAMESWPAVVGALAVCAALAYLGWFDVVWRSLLIVFAAFYVGYVFRGRLTESLREKYPKASQYWLLSVGLCSATLGVIVRMLMPERQGSLTDYVWLSTSFVTILAFIVINRRHPDVLK